MDFSVKDIKMGIKNIHNGNTVVGKSYSYAFGILAIALCINDDINYSMSDSQPNIRPTKFLLLNFVNCKPNLILNFCLDDKKMMTCFK